jgi:hypothetical protein
MHKVDAGSGAVTASLILDLLEWLAPGPRSYVDVMEAWRTSCPRLTVWEDAVDEGYVVRRWIENRSMVELTPQGHRRLLEGRYSSCH